MDPIVIIGSGLAGYTLAREFRKLDKETPLMVVTRDDGHFYSKPMLSAAFASSKGPAQLVQTGVEKMGADLELEILTGVEVLKVNTEQRVLTVEVRQREKGWIPAPRQKHAGAGSAGMTVGSDVVVRRYSRLVLALGADPAVPALSGNAAADVLTVNDLADYARFRDLLDNGKRVAIIGAGLIGCEFANDLAAHGHVVSVVDPAPAPLGRLLPPAMGEALAAALAALGVQWHFGVTPVSVDRVEGGAGYRLALSDRQVIEADVVLSAIGLRPRTALANLAGLGIARGIRVNRLLESSVPGVYALGDCAEVEGLNLPFVMPIMHAARALAATLAGTPTPLSYPAMPVVVKTPALPVVVAPPTPVCDGTWEISGSGGDLRGLFVDAAGTLRGFALSGQATSEKGKLAATLGHWLP